MNNSGKAARIGTLVNLKRNTDMRPEFERLTSLGLYCCQLCCWDNSAYTPETAKAVVEAAAEYSVTVTALWAGWSGPREWNFTGGPATLGLVPPAYRDKRLSELLEASGFASLIGVTDVITHVGFLPENPDHPDFTGVCCALRHLAGIMKKRGQFFLFETGQETPVTMLRTIETIGTDNLGINFDTANLLLYGKANSADALDVFGKYVRNTHFKDGEYPTTGTALGAEKPLGKGRADISKIIGKLNALDYAGPYIIEREVSGDKTADILSAADLIRSLL